MNNLADESKKEPVLSDEELECDKKTKAKYKKWKKYFIRQHEKYEEKINMCNKLKNEITLSDYKLEYKNKEIKLLEEDIKRCANQNKSLISKHVRDTNEIKFLRGLFNPSRLVLPPTTGKTVAELLENPNGLEYSDSDIKKIRSIYESYNTKPDVLKYIEVILKNKRMTYKNKRDMIKIMLEATEKTYEQDYDDIIINNELNIDLNDINLDRTVTRILPDFESVFNIPPRSLTNLWIPEHNYDNDLVPDEEIKEDYDYGPYRPSDLIPSLQQSQVSLPTPPTTPRPSTAIRSPEFSIPTPPTTPRPPTAIRSPEFRIPVNSAGYVNNVWFNHCY